MINLDDFDENEGMSVDFECIWVGTGQLLAS